MWKNLYVGLLLVFLFTPNAVAVPVLQEDFNTGIAGWQTEGNVLSLGGQGQLDDTLGYSSLFKGVSITPGKYIFSFDYTLGLSQDSLDGFPDGFYVSLYFTNDLKGFSLLDKSTYTAALPILDVAPFPYKYIGPQFDVLDSYGAFIIPVFELFGFNGIADSSVSIDNVLLAQTESPTVPEPGSLALLSGGALLLGGWRSRTKSHNNH